MSKNNTSLSQVLSGMRSRTPVKVTISQLDLDAASNSTNSKLSSRREMQFDTDVLPPDIEARTSHLTEEVKRLSGINHILEEQIQALKASNKKTDREKELEQKFSLLLGENERLNNVINNYKKLQSQQTKQDEFLNQLKDLREKFTTSEKVIKGLTDQLSFLKADNARLKSDLNLRDTEQKQNQEKIEVLIKEKISLEESNERLRNSIKEVQESLHKQFVELTEAIQTDGNPVPVANAQAAIEQNLRTLTEELSASRIEHEGGQDSYTYVLYAKLEELDQARKQIKALQNENDQMKTALAKISEDSKEQSEDRSNVHFLCSFQQIDQREDQKEDQKPNDEILKENEALKESLKVLLQAAEELKSRCLSYEERLESKDKDINALQEELHKSEGERTLLITKLQQALQEKKLLHDNLVAATTNLPRPEIPKSKSKPTHKRSESQPSKSLDLETENQLLKNRILQLLDDNQKLNLALQHKIKQTSHPAQLEETIAKLEAEIESFKTKLAALLKENERVNILLQDRDEEIMLLKAKVQQNEKSNQTQGSMRQKYQDQNAIPLSPIEKLLDNKSSYGEIISMNSARSNQVTPTRNTPLAQINHLENRYKPVVQINLPLKSEKQNIAPSSPAIKHENPRLDSIKSPGYGYGLLNDNVSLTNSNPPTGDNYTLPSIDSGETYRLRRTLIDLIQEIGVNNQIYSEIKETHSVNSSEFSYK